MKNINKNTLIIIALVISVIFCNSFWYHYTREVQAELTEQKKPSFIEKVYTELKNKEKHWQELEKIIQEKTEEKLGLEPQIQELRRQLLGSKK